MRNLKLLQVLVEFKLSDPDYISVQKHLSDKIELQRRQMKTVKVRVTRRKSIVLLDTAFEVLTQ